MKTMRFLAFACVVGPALVVTAPVHAQDVQYETVTKVEFPGALGTMVRVAARLGGGSTEVVETTYIKGSRMRTDVDRTSSVIDLEERRFISIDHEAKTYYVMTFDDMIAQARRAGEQVEAARREERGTDAAETHLNFRFSIDDAGQRERVAGYNANRFFITVEMEGEYTPEGAEQREKGGTLVLLTDLWASRDVPVLQARGTFDDASARDVAEAGAAFTQALAAAFADDPRLKVAFEQSAKEAEKIEGMAVKTVTRFVAVAPEQKFDRQLALGERSAGPGVAQQAGRAALRGLAARAAGAAGQQQQQQQQEAAEETQATILSITSEMRNVRTRSLDAALFQPPAGYREARPEGMR